MGSDARVALWLVGIPAPHQVMKLHVGAWSGLPIEAVFVWFAVTFTTVITYEVIKIWKVLGTRALEAFFGIRK